MRYLSFLKHYKLSIIVAVAIFYVSILKPAQLPSNIPLFAGADKLVHLLMYFGLGLTLNLETKRTQKYLLYIVLAFPVLYGGIIELLQANFFPPRTGEWLDFLANFTGVLLAYFIYRTIIYKKN
ncbi:MAG: VanZ family protein [Prevotellaceae bacterium]|jgi:VanZ family protein|nr:VanZ family protein [Prevotellaceae bacterium]